MEETNVFIKKNKNYLFEGQIIQQLIFLCFQNSAMEMVLSKQLSLDVQESMKNTEDEQKVNELQNQPLELDVMLRSEQLKEIEVWKQEKH